MASRYIPYIQYKHTVPTIRYFVDNTEDVCDYCGVIESTQVKKEGVYKYRVCQRCNSEEYIDIESESSESESDYEE